MFATRSGNVRRNDLSDFVEVRQNGKIAMKLDEGDQIVGVQICTEEDNVLLTSAQGRAIRFPVTDVRVFKGRGSTGVRGIRLEEDDSVISMTILRHVDSSPAERSAYVKQANALRRGVADEEAIAEAEPDDEDILDGDADLTPERYAELSANEQFVLTISENGFGKRTSAYEYRTSGRGGKGIIAMAVNKRNGRLIASFPVEETDQIMLVTNGGQLIRVPVNGISILGRSTQGVTVFKTAMDEQVVSVEHISDVDADDDGEEGGDPNEDGTHPDSDEGTAS